MCGTQRVVMRVLAWAQSRQGSACRWASAECTATAGALAVAAVWIAVVSAMATAMVALGEANKIDTRPTRGAAVAGRDKGIAGSCEGGDAGDAD